MPVGVTSMAFQMSTLACRIKIPISFGVLTHSRGINSGKSVWSDLEPQFKL
uniref:Uncharacterized protein n=1 Tax=Anguilla anguilla TaxID=7936 RepID=A0A0E9VX28_ANGAN